MEDALTAAGVVVAALSLLPFHWFQVLDSSTAAAVVVWLFSPFHWAQVEDCSTAAAGVVVAAATLLLPPHTLPAETVTVTAGWVT